MLKKYLIAFIFALLLLGLGAYLIRNDCGYYDTQEGQTTWIPCE